MSVFYSAGISKLARVVIEVLDHQYQWLAGGYDLEIGHF